LKSVASFRADLQFSASSSHVRQLARTHHTLDVDSLPGRFHEPSRPDRAVRRLTPPITARDLRHVPDFYSTSTLDSATEAPGRRLRSACGQVDLRAAGLQEQDEAELWLARTLHAGGQVTSSEEDHTSKDDTEDELSK